MVVSEQVQDAVHGQQVDLVGGRVSGRRRLLCRDVGTQRDVAQVALGLLLGIYVAISRIFVGGDITAGTAALIALLLISGSQFSLFAMWFDMESNKDLR